MGNRPRVLVTRLLPLPGMDKLEMYFELDVNEEDRVLAHAVLCKRIRDKDGLLCLLNDRIDKTVIEAGAGLRIIANYAVGFDNIDLETAGRMKIPVTNTPDALTEATADLAMGLIISVARRIVESDRYLRHGKFEGWAPELMLGTDVHGKTLGLLGIGRIGRAVAERARGFNMHVMYHDPARLSLDEEKTRRVEYRTLDDLLANADFVSVHAPLNERTRHLISTDELGKMKKTAYLINTARGAIIDEGALVRALEDGKIAGCALDVFENEPVVHPDLITMNNAVLVPHIGSASVEARTKMSLMACDNLIAVLIEGKRPPNIVNPGIYS